MRKMNYSKHLGILIFSFLLYFGAFSQASFYDHTTNLYGIIDSDGNEIVKPTFKDLSRITNKTGVFFNGNKYGLLNESGKVILPPIYLDECQLYDSEYSEGLINIVRRKFLNEDSTSWNEERAYVNENGKVIIDFTEIAFAGKFCNGKAIIGKYDENYDFVYNVIDRNGFYLLENWISDYNELNVYTNCFVEKNDTEETLVRENAGEGKYIYKNDQRVIESNICNNSYAIYYQTSCDRVLIYTTDNKLFLLNGKGDIISEISSVVNLNGKAWDNTLQFFNNGIIHVRAKNENYQYDHFLLDLEGRVLKVMLGNGPHQKDDCNDGSH